MSAGRHLKLIGVVIGLLGLVLLTVVIGTTHGMRYVAMLAGLWFYGIGVAAVAVSYERSDRERERR